MSFSEQLVQDVGPLWEMTITHPFLRKTADGTIPDDDFKNWMAQDYLYAEGAVPFVSILLAKAPISLRQGLSDGIQALNQELDMFRRQAAEHGVLIEGVQPTPTCHSYVQFLLANAYSQSFLEGFTVLYAEEKAYLESWKWVKSHQKEESPWQSFIDNWTSPGFEVYVDWIATSLDDLAQACNRAQQAHLAHLFRLTIRYEYLFWEMALNGERWPDEVS